MYELAYVDHGVLLLTVDICSSFSLEIMNDFSVCNAKDSTVSTAE
jgi:hypothetical protein